MHCTCCNQLLTDFESTRKNAITKDYVDLCKRCFEDVKGLFPVIERKDLITESDLDPSEQDIGENLDSGDCRDYIDYIVSNDDYDV